MNKYDSDAFVQAFQKKVDKKLTCAICGCDQFSTEDTYAAIITEQYVGNITLKTSVPSGMLFCQNCGHIEFFALGTLQSED